MGKELAIPFPLRGVDANWAYGKQPPLTTPDALNVRGYSADAERARGGSRPGLTYAYGGYPGTATPIQWLGWLDWGFGDTVIYDDDFNYAAGDLGDNAAWAGAAVSPTDPRLKVENNYVYPYTAGALPITDLSAGDYQSFAGDEWDQFSLEAGLQWGYGSSGDITFWVSSASGAATDGMTCKVAYTSVPITEPGLGYSSSLTITLTSNGSTVWSRNFGVLFSWTGGVVRIDADTSQVRVYWDGRQVAAVVRDLGVCSLAGFKMSLSNPGAEDGFPASYCKFRLLSWHLTAITSPTAIARRFVTISNRYVYAETSEGTLGASAVDTDQLADVAMYSAAHCNGQLFMLDGTTPRIYNPMGATTSIIYNWTARRGKVEPTATIIANWRNRLVLTGTLNDPQNWFMSRVDDPWDFDYGQDDAESAVAGNDYANGRIGDPITALCPISNDALVFGCTRSIYVMRGDPAAGGRVYKVSSETGMLGPNAWCTDGQGTMWFLGEEGLFVMPASGGEPRNVTNRRLPSLAGYKSVMPGRNAAYQSGRTYVSLAYDADRHGVLIFLAPYASATATHYFYDIRNDAFWPESYPDAMGPTMAAYYNATTSTYRKLLLGGRNGCIYYYSEATKRDETGAQTTAAISSRVLIGPVRLGGGIGDALITRLIGVTSTGSEVAGWGLYAGVTPEACAATAVSDGAAVTNAQASGTWSAGRNVDRSRVRGGAHAVKVYNATTARRWALESITAEVEPGGTQR